MLPLDTAEGKMTPPWTGQRRRANKPERVEIRDSTAHTERVTDNRLVRHRPHTSPGSPSRDQEQHAERLACSRESPSIINRNGINY